MDVNKIKVKYNPTMSGDTYINIGISLTHTPTGQDDTRLNSIIQDEIAKDINPIVDYERFRYKCIYNSGSIYEIKYTIQFIDGNMWSDIGFHGDDLKYQKNALLMSYMEIKFYDSEDTSNRKLVDKIKLYPNNLRLSYNNQFPNTQVEFIVSSDINDKSSNNDGFYLYNKMNTITNSDSLYGEASFFNAKTGKKNRLATGNGITNVIPLNLMNTNIYLKYIFTNNFNYTVNNCVTTTYSTPQKTNNEQTLKISLFELKII